MKSYYDADEVPEDLRQYFDRQPPSPCPSVVLDPFCGAGTTGMVAAQLGRDFVGFDLNPKYCEMARKRIEPHARQAVLL